MNERASLRVAIDRVRVRVGAGEVSPERLQAELARELSRRLRSRLEHGHRPPLRGGRTSGGRKGAGVQGGDRLAAVAARQLADEVVERMSGREW